MKFVIVYLIFRKINLFERDDWQVDTYLFEYFTLNIVEGLRREGVENIGLNSNTKIGLHHPFSGVG
jgi:hypothetical protein